MDNRRIAALFFGLGFLVIVAGIFMTKNDTTNTPNGSSPIQPQIINRGINNFIPKAVNENAGNNNGIFNNDTCQKIITELDNVPGIDNVDAVVAGNSAIVTCSAADNAKQNNFKDMLVNKVKGIDPTLTNVYVMENTDNMNKTFSQISTQVRNGDMTNAKQAWDNMWKQIAPNINR